MADTSVSSVQTRIETYIPLYRKYRPQTFADVVGQEAIVQTLGNAIRLNKVAHAYLFCGPRGTGKTSAARIFAKSLNCEQGPTVEPCLQCASCIGITQGNALDVIEFDAASNNGVGDARELIENCQYTSMSGRFKVYIIDEVHMLTTQAFNALLKTLEEPPPNVIFIFATTEAHKVLPTIISRCQRFDFNRITTADIVNRLRWIAEREAINVDDEAILMIARHARGGLRDAVGLLDQVAVLGRANPAQSITRQDVALFIGTLEEDLLLRLSAAIAERQAAVLLDDLTALVNRGIEPIQLLKDLTIHFRNLLLVQATGDQAESESLSLPPDYHRALLAQMPLFPEPEELPQIIGRLSVIERNVRNSNQPHLWLEVGLMELAYRHEIHLVKTLSERLARLEAQMAAPGSLPGGLPAVAPVSPTQSTVKQPASTIPARPVAKPHATPPTVPQPAQAAASKMAQMLPGQTEAVVQPPVTTSPGLDRLEPAASSGALESLYAKALSGVPSLYYRSLLEQQTFPIALVEDVLTIGCVGEDNLSKVQKPDKLLHFEKALATAFGRPMKLEFRLEAKRTTPADVNAPLPSVGQSVVSTTVAPVVSAVISPVSNAAEAPQPEQIRPGVASENSSTPVSTGLSDGATSPVGAIPLSESELTSEAIIAEGHDPAVSLQPLICPESRLPQQQVEPLPEDKAASKTSPEIISHTTLSREEITARSVGPESDPALDEAKRHALELLQGKVLD